MNTKPRWNPQYVHWLQSDSEETHLPIPKRTREKRDGGLWKVKGSSFHKAIVSNPCLGAEKTKQKNMEQFKNIQSPFRKVRQKRVFLEEDSIFKKK